MAKNVRIQLASNFQVIELTYDSWNDVMMDELELATDCVNRLGKEVINDIKTAPKTQEKKKEMATDKQVDFLVGKYGQSRDKVKKLTKKEAWNLINDLKTKAEEAFPKNFEEWEDSYYDDL